MNTRSHHSLAAMAAFTLVLFAVFTLAGLALVAYADAAPLRLSETGLHRADGSSAPRALSVAAASSDRAEVSRWVSLPRGAKLDAAALNAWRLPAGATLWQEFVENGRKVETRMLRVEADGRWTLASYVWLADQTDALLSSEPLLPEAFDAAPRARGEALEISQNLALPR